MHHSKLTTSEYVSLLYTFFKELKYYRYLLFSPSAEEVKIWIWSVFNACTDWGCQFSDLHTLINLFFHLIPATFYYSFILHLVISNNEGASWYQF